MDFNKIITEGSLLYTSREKDTNLRMWRLEKNLCNITYYKSLPLSDLDKVILLICSSYNIIHENDLAGILGFNVIDDFDASPKRYKDPGELDIFKAILDDLLQFCLIYIREDHKICMTTLGKAALLHDEKYVFYKGSMLLMQSFDLADKTSAEYLFLPYRTALGFTSRLINEVKLAYDDFLIDTIEEKLYGTPNDLARRLSLQQEENYRIIEAEKTSEARMGDGYVDFRLYSWSGSKYPLVFYRGEISIPVNNLLFKEENTSYRNTKVHIAEYLFLVRDSKRLLNYLNLKPYFDVWDLDDLLESPYFDWNDVALFAEIAKVATGSQWCQISQLCPIEILKGYLPDYSGMFEWTVLSERFDDDFVADNALLYPWDFELLSSTRNIGLIKRLIIISELHNDIDWDWERILPQLDYAFIAKHIEVIPFKMFCLTEQYLNEYKEVIVSYPDRGWDWELLSREADLGYLLDNVKSLGSKLYLDIVMNRAFLREEWVTQYCDSLDFSFCIVEQKNHLLQGYNANGSHFAWNNFLISWMEKMGFIEWPSTTNTIGFECNPYLSWDKEFFNSYKGKPFTDKGLIHISECIKDLDSIKENPSFGWKWDVLSKQELVVSDLSFVVSHLAKLDLAAIIASLQTRDVDLLYAEEEFQKLCSEYQLWALVTEKVSDKVIREKPNYDNWDWNVLTKRFCSSMKVPQLGNPKWSNKLDWNYLSENLELEDLQEYLYLYTQRWDWKSVTKRVDHDYLLDNLSEYNSLWDWEEIVKSKLTKEDFLNDSVLNQASHAITTLDNDQKLHIWTLLTSHYSTSFILDHCIITSKNLAFDNSLVYHWNWEDVYNRKDFEIMPYLEQFKQDQFHVDWEALSSSKTLNNLLHWDKKVTQDFNLWKNLVIEILSEPKYLWNFKYLSTLDSINWCDDILKINSDEWDWAYLSLHSRCFATTKKPKEFEKHILKFKDKIDFAVLSSRTDIQISLDFLESTKDFPWDWCTISSSKSFVLSSVFVEANPHFDWNWNALSQRKDCVFSASFIAANKDFDWDWTTLSKRLDVELTDTVLEELVDKPWDWNQLIFRKDLNFEPSLLRLIVEKEIDWYKFSQSSNFIPSLEVLQLLNHKKLDWNKISADEQLSITAIETFKDKVNWTVLQNKSVISYEDIQLLDKYKDYLDWKLISASEKFSISYNNLSKFKEYLKWDIISRRSDFTIDAQTLSAFEMRLDWQRISRNANIVFTREIVEKYKTRWDWIALAQNPAFASANLGVELKEEMNLKKFYNELKKYSFGSPHIYHFTHLFNAVEVIRTRKILSRNRAQELGLLKYDAAGAVVNRTAKAHPYARFYFRTGTPTQFYNECLGIQNGKYYYRALDFGLPMCPMPVFFKFDLQEVLVKRAKLCFYGTGNMQAGSTRIVKVCEDPSQIDAKNLYSNGYTDIVKEKKQQEFLIKNEFEFSDINNFQIICFDQAEANILKAIFANDPISEHIYLAGNDQTEDVYERRNPQLEFEKTNDSLKINTNYCREYMFQVESDNIKRIKIYNTKDIKTEKKKIIQLRNRVSVALGKDPFEVFFINLNPNARTSRWLVYQHTPQITEVLYTESSVIEDFLDFSFEDGSFSPVGLMTALTKIIPLLSDLYDTKVRHYYVRDHTRLVCEQFEKYPFDFNSEVMNLDLMRIILALHDVGKAIDRDTQHEHTLSIVHEFMSLSPFSAHEKQLADVLLKDDHLGAYYQGKYSINELGKEIRKDSALLRIKSEELLQLKMILYQCDIASYTKDAGGLRYLEHMFVYKEGEKTFDSDNGLLLLSGEFQDKYQQLLSIVYE